MSKRDQVAFLVVEEATKPTCDDAVIGPLAHPRLACHAGATPNLGGILRRTALGRMIVIATDGSSVILIILS